MFITIDIYVTNTNTKKSFNVRYFRPLTSAQTPTSYCVTLK